MKVFDTLYYYLDTERNLEFAYYEYQLFKAYNRKWVKADVADYPDLILNKLEEYTHYNRFVIIGELYLTGCIQLTQNRISLLKGTGKFTKSKMLVTAESIKYDDTEILEHIGLTLGTDSQQYQYAKHYYVPV